MNARQWKDWIIRCMGGLSHDPRNETLMLIHMMRVDNRVAMLDHLMSKANEIRRARGLEPHSIHHEFTLGCVCPTCAYIRDGGERMAAHA